MLLTISDAVASAVLRLPGWLRPHRPARPVSPARASVVRPPAVGIAAARRRVGRLQGLEGVEQRVVA
ncbi:MAG: hypothetical protein IIC50_07735 [Planctomycetes bacterium]|nr:hypothetical protein [Planctomycetota bacterium]